MGGPGGVGYPSKRCLTHATHHASPARIHTPLEGGKAGGASVCALSGGGWGRRGGQERTGEGHGSCGPHGAQELCVGRAHHALGGLVKDVGRVRDAMLRIMRAVFVHGVLSHGGWDAGSEWTELENAEPKILFFFPFLDFLIIINLLLLF